MKAHRYTSNGTKGNVIHEGQGQILRSQLNKKNKKKKNPAILGSISVSQTQLVFFF